MGGTRKDIRVIPSMLKKVLRAQDGDRRFLRYKLGRLERGGDDIIPAALYDTRDEPSLLCLSRGEVARGVRELVDEALITCDLGQAGECTDVSCKADIHFLKIIRLSMTGMYIILLKRNGP